MPCRESDPPSLAPARFNFWSSAACRLLAGGLLLAAGGCGDGRPQRVPISGQVLIDGQPLAFVTVWVIPENARAASGTTAADGRFHLTTYDANDGCVRGKHRVAVTGYKNLSETELAPLVPLHYQDVASSGLTLSITGPQDDVKLELTWNGRQPERQTVNVQGDALGLPLPPSNSLP